MAFERLVDDLNIIAALDPLPNDEGGLTSEQLRSKFDEGPNKIKTFVNAFLTALESATGADSIGFTPPSGMISITLQDAIAEIFATALEAQAGTILPASITDAMLANAPTKFKPGSGTFLLGETTFTVTDAFITDTTWVDVSPDLTNKVGDWSVVSYNGYFTITSMDTETVNVDFDWGAIK